MTRILLTREETCRDCEGQGTLEEPKRSCFTGRDLPRGERCSLWNLYTDDLVCQSCGKPTEPVLWHCSICATCNGTGKVIETIALAEAFADAAVQTALLCAIGPTLARLLDMPEQAVTSANGSHEPSLAAKAGT